MLPGGPVSLALLHKKLPVHLLSGDLLQKRPWHSVHALSFVFQSYRSVTGLKYRWFCTIRIHPILPWKRCTMANLAIVQNDFGSGKEPWDKLELVKLEKPHEAKPGHLLVRITTRSVNPTDLMTIGRNNVTSRNKDGVIGSEGVGVVQAVGEGVTNFRVGERVVPLLLDGYLASWQQYVQVKEEQAFRVPDNISDEVAAQAWINPFTVYAILGELQIPKGEYLLQTAAGSVLGRVLIQWAKHIGVKTINVVRRDEAKEELKALGADEVINSETEDIVERVKEITGGKLAYAAIDAIAGQIPKVLAKSVRDGGRLLVYGMLSGVDVTLDTRDLGFARRVHFSVFNFFHYLKTQEGVIKAAAEVFPLLGEKVIEPLVGEKFDLADFKEALKASQKVARGGKVLLVG